MARDEKAAALGRPAVVANSRIEHGALGGPDGKTNVLQVFEAGQVVTLDPKTCETLIASGAARVVDPRAEGEADG